ncbi:MAG: sensor domain-containing diguanylate cyclase [Planctomycetota bacterium]
MGFDHGNGLPTSTQLLAVIKTQTEIAKLGLDLNGLMTFVAEQAQAITNATGAVVELAEGDDMVYRAVAGAASNLLGLRLQRKTSLSGLCVASATMLSCSDSETDPRVDREACRRVGLRSMAVVPLIHDGNAVGVLKVFSPLVSAFGGTELHVLQLMSEVIAAAMFNAAKFGADELFRQATTDCLTGLANRALFLDRLRHGIVKAKREGWRLGALMVDMDGLKPINDRYGHRAGDAAIQEMARRLGVDARQSDTVARLGGDEFAIVLSTVADRASADLAMERIAERCNRPFTFEDRPLPLGASLGVALYPDDAVDPANLIEMADQAMYAAKRKRKILPMSRSIAG